MNTKTNSVYNGSCLCGSIQYQAKNLSPKMGHCHCSMCRKFHGAAFATFGEVTAENFRLIKGAELLKSYKAENGTTRKFCGQCGSSLIFEAGDDHNHLVEFSLATLDDAIELRPDAHIYTAYKADWLELNDELPKYPEGRKA